MSISPNGIEIEESVHPCDDRAANKAEELYGKWQDRTGCDNPPRFYRDEFVAIIATELRKAYRLAELESEAKESSWNHINLLEAEIARLRAELEKLKFKTGPVQTGKGGAGRIQVPWSILERAYAVYSGKYGTDQTLERLCERGGFGESELDMFVPGWREEMSEINRLRAELAKVKP